MLELQDKRDMYIFPYLLIYVTIPFLGIEELRSDIVKLNWIQCIALLSEPNLGCFSWQSSYTEMSSKQWVKRWNMVM
jgi:hypothetical protein